MCGVRSSVPLRTVAPWVPEIGNVNSVQLLGTMAWHAWRATLECTIGWGSERSHYNNPPCAKTCAVRDPALHVPAPAPAEP